MNMLIDKYCRHCCFEYVQNTNFALDWRDIISEGKAAGQGLDRKKWRHCEKGWSCIDETWAVMQGLIFVRAGEAAAFGKDRVLVSKRR